MLFRSNAFVNRAHAIDCMLGGDGRAERCCSKKVGRALQATPRIVAVIGMRGDACHGDRMQRLEKKCAQSADEHRRIAVHTNDRAIFREPARPGAEDRRGRRETRRRGRAHHGCQGRVAGSRRATVTRDDGSRNRLTRGGRETGLAGAAEFDLKPLLDLVALGTVADLVPLIGKLAKALERAVLVGHSMGTPVIRQFYRKYPAKTRALVIVDGGLKSEGTTESPNP